jgi:hypothetical protein
VVICIRTLPRGWPRVVARISFQRLSSIERSAPATDAKEESGEQSIDRDSLPCWRPVRDTSLRGERVGIVRHGTVAHGQTVSAALERLGALWGHDQMRRGAAGRRVKVHLFVREQGQPRRARDRSSLDELRTPDGQRERRCPDHGSPGVERAVRGCRELLIRAHRPGRVDL